MTGIPLPCRSSPLAVGEQMLERLRSEIRKPEVGGGGQRTRSLSRAARGTTRGFAQIRHGVGVAGRILAVPAVASGVLLVGPSDAFAAAPASSIKAVQLNTPAFKRDVVDPDIKASDVREQLYDVRCLVTVLDLWIRDFQSRRGGRVQGMYSLDRASIISDLNVQLNQAEKRIFAGERPGHASELSAAAQLLSQVESSDLFKVFEPAAFDSIPSQVIVLLDSIQRLTEAGYLSPGPLLEELEYQLNRVQDSYRAGSQDAVSLLKGFRERYEALVADLLDQYGISARAAQPQLPKPLRPTFSNNKLKVDFPALLAKARANYERGGKGTLFSSEMGDLLNLAESLSQIGKEEVEKADRDSNHDLRNAYDIHAALNFYTIPLEDLADVYDPRPASETTPGSIADTRAELAESMRSGKIKEGSQTARAISELLDLAEKLKKEGSFYRETQFTARWLAQSDPLMGLPEKRPNRLLTSLIGAGMLGLLVGAGGAYLFYRSPKPDAADGPPADETGMRVLEIE